MTDVREDIKSAQGSTARIYQFPLRGRHLDAVREREAPRYLAAASGDSWYHQAAIDEEKH